MRSKAKQAREAEQVPARVKALTGSMAAPTAKKTSRNSVYLFAIALFLTSGGLFAFLVWNASLPVALLGGVAVGLVASSTVRIAPQWERVVVLRLGKFNRIDGPGLYVVVPIVESVAARVDQRIITTPFSAEGGCDGRPCAAGHRCGAVLDGLGSQRRLRGGGRLFISGMVGCSNRPARCGGSHQSRRGGDAPRANWTTK